MKSIILVALAFVAVTVALPVEKEVPQIISQQNEQNPEGGYYNRFETDDGTVREETGELKEFIDEENKPHQAIAVRGSYKYVNPDGQPEEVTFYADNTGYHAQGKSIPEVARA